MWRGLSSLHCAWKLGSEVTANFGEYLSDWTQTEEPILQNRFSTCPLGASLVNPVKCTQDLGNIMQNKVTEL